jgi:hypothetical protein
MRNFRILLLLVLYSTSTFSTNFSNDEKLKNQAKETNTFNEKSIAQVRSFLSWYKLSYLKIGDLQNRIVSPVRYNSGKIYRVNFQQSKKYLALINSSGYFSKEFLMNLTEFFKSIDKKLIELKQDDGVPEGFEGDLLLKTQEPEWILNNISNLEIKIISQSKVRFVLKLENRLYFILNKDFKIMDIDYKIR